MFLFYKGGTADITVHEKQNGDNLKELCRASGGDCGGTSVDKAFIQMLVKVFGAPLIHALKRDEPEAYLDLIREFETVKRTVTPSKSGMINMAIPYATLDSLCRKHLREDLSTSFSSSPYAKTIYLRGDKIRIDADLFRSIFNQTIHNLIEQVNEVLEKKESRSVVQILLVGGFSECLLVQNAIKKEFSKCRVVVPKECDMAVLKGAVLFGHKPSFIASRITRYTYGIKIDQRFNGDVHDVKFKQVSGGKEYCKNVFDVIMKKDTHVSAGTTVKRQYCSNYKSKYAKLSVFVSENVRPMYVIEEGCTLLGSVIIKVCDSSIKHNYDVELVFGNTELNIRVTDTDLGNNVEAKFNLI